MKKDMLMAMFIFGLLFIIRDDVWTNKQTEIRNFMSNFYGNDESMDVSFKYEAIGHDFGIAYWSDAAMPKLRRAGKEYFNQAKLDALKAKIQAAITANKAWAGFVNDGEVEAKCLSLGLHKKTIGE